MATRIDGVRAVRVIESVIDEHEYGGDGKCRCGAAIGHSDGIAWTTYLSEHVAARAVDELVRHGFLTPGDDDD